MNKNLRWKALTILAVLVLSVWAFYPPQEKVRLGLDLKGGVHLVMRVQTDDALRLETEVTSERLREELSRANILVTSVAQDGPQQFTVQGVPQGQDAEFRRIADEQTSAMYNRESGAGGTYRFSLKPNIAVTLRGEAVAQALQTIERRVNELGVAEPIVAAHGAGGDQILVQLPGVTDVARAKEIIRSTALLELKIVEGGPAPTRESLLAATNGVLPPDMEVVTGADEFGLSGQPGGTIYYLVRRVAAVTGRILTRASRPAH